ncbi:hypothetical protein BJ912DRAFT_969551 [Pholiota molesta]|nr:hypothetical protein BJ912DRAFT_969551 [Pholiota molesta]
MVNQQIDGQSIAIVKISKEDTVNLRHSVLWPDMPPEHARPIDKSEEPQPSPDGTSTSKTKEPAIRFRKFACDPQYQGKGLGTWLLLHALSIARSELGVHVAWCDARRTTEDCSFFKGPVEYIRMELDLPLYPFLC